MHGEATHTRIHLRFLVRFIRRTMCRLMRLPYCLGKVSFGPILPEVIITVNPFTLERSKLWWAIEHNLKPQEYSTMTGYFIYYDPFFWWCYTAYCLLETFCTNAVSMPIKCSSNVTKPYEWLKKRRTSCFITHFTWAHR